MHARHINYSAAYSFADSTVSAVKDPSSIAHGDIIGDFFGFKTSSFFQQIGLPQKHTLLHEFIYSINEFPLQHYLGKIDGDTIVENYKYILDGANILPPRWFNSREIGRHIDDFRPTLDRAIKKISEAAFQLLFSDRTFLFEFSKFIQPFISKLQPTDHPYIIAPGVVGRAHFPVWLRNAVFHRDKGRCQLCGCDLTNILVPTASRHIDHMVPLRAGGTNDPSNFQLTCGKCNTSKGAKIYALEHNSFPFW